MNNASFKYPDQAAYKLVTDQLAAKNITYKEIAAITRPEKSKIGAEQQVVISSSSPRSFAQPLCFVMSSSSLNEAGDVIVFFVNAIKSIMCAGIGIYIVYILLYYILGKKQLEKGVNVD